MGGNSESEKELMLFGIPEGGASQNFMHPLTGKSFRITDADYTKDLVSFKPEGGYEVMPAPKIIGETARKNQLTVKQYKSMTQDMDPEDAAQQYEAYLLEQMLA